MNKIIEGDLLDVKEGIIVHQVNCKGYAGAGLALQIRQKWPSWYNNYRLEEKYLGKTSIFQVNSNLYIANLYAQLNVGTNTTQTNYEAFCRCLNSLKEQNAINLEVYMPYKIGCGLAGGNWQVIKQKIYKILPEAIIIKRQH